MNFLIVDPVGSISEPIDAGALPAGFSCTGHSSNCAIWCRIVSCDVWECTGEYKCGSAADATFD